MAKGDPKMRDRLIELIEAEGGFSRYMTDDERRAKLADHLLAEGVIVPPCKVGQTVYSITECSCEDIDGVHTECEFYGYGEDDRICLIPNGAKCPYQYRIMECYVTEANILMFTRMWGKTVFLTREEAEKALAERSENENNI
jgi:hypothetical protein